MKILAAIALVMGLSAHAQDVYQVDPSHASVVFKVSHMDFSNVYGLIGGAEGKITVDEKAPEKSTFEVTVKPDTLTTLDKKRDEHLRGPDFFNVKQFPTITLKSKSIKKNGADKLDVTADLTLRGITKPITFTFKRMKTGKDPWGNSRMGGETVFKFKRTDFGMNYMSKPGEVGDEVEMMISLEGMKK